MPENAMARLLAEQHGWIETPDGDWWREIDDGEYVINGDRIHRFLGSGPFLWARDAEDCLVADGLLEEV